MHILRVSASESAPAPGAVMSCRVISSEEPGSPCQRTRVRHRWTQSHSPPWGKPSCGGCAQTVSVHTLSGPQPEPPVSVPKRYRKMPAVPARWPAPQGWYTATSSYNCPAMCMGAPRHHSPLRRDEHLGLVTPPPPLLQGHSVFGGVLHSPLCKGGRGGICQSWASRNPSIPLYERG
jgi:hypothetical protein